jgi:hypothetical protein
MRIATLAFHCHCRQRANTLNSKSFNYE